MPFKTGRIANPTGINRRKPWADAVRIVMNEDDPETQRPRLLLLAERLFTEAMAGDMAAIKEIGDRLDGKPAQAVVGDPEPAGGADNPVADGGGGQGAAEAGRGWP